MRTQVKLDERGERILAIGGNVRGVVSLKLLPSRACTWEKPARG
jgi:hypothetical protein